MKGRFIAASLLASTSALVFTGAAAAQSATPSDTPAPAPEITVTGSRVIKNGSASPTPLTTVSTTALAVAAPSGTISDQLNLLPVFSGSRGAFSNPGANATNVQGGNGAADVLNLRNIGFYRTLVLFDGHRIPPTLYNSAVDVDMIPQELISRVDVVTGGVSAVYGSDAVSGVVNYVLDHNYNGFRAHASSGISQYGDAANFDVGGAVGFHVGSQGHFEFSVEHRQNDGILNRVGSRSWDNLPALEGAGTAANPYKLDTNVHLASLTFGGLITSGVLKGQTFGAGTTLSPFVNGAAIPGTSSIQIGGGGAYQDASMISPTRSTQVFGRFDWDFSPTLHGYVQVAGNFKTVTSYTGYNQLSGENISSTNAFLPAAYQAELAAAGQSSFNMSEMLSSAPRIQDVSNTYQYYINAGLDGKIHDWAWSATYTHGASTMETTVNNQVNYQNLSAALNAVVNPANGQVVCAAALTNPSQYGNCVPLNIFGTGSPSQAALNYVLGSDTFVTHTIQDSADASISGTPFSTWAGPVNLALSAEWRRQAFDAGSSVLPTDVVDCGNGLTNNCSASATSTQIPLYATTYPNSPVVSQSVKEAAVELELPLLKDVPLFKSLDLNSAARYTDYSTTGKYWTWKVGGVWEVNDDLKFRGTVSRDIRAPTLFDLYQPETVVYGNFTDVKTGTTAYLPSVNISNPNLTAEIGHTWTAGFVYKPHWLRGTTLTFDYYHTVVDNAITEISSINAAIQTACNTGGVASYCSLIQRNSQGAVTAYYNAPQNIAELRTFGFDTEFDYVTRLFDTHPFSLRVLGNYQPHIYYIQPGVPTDDQGDAGWAGNGLEPSPSVQISAFVDFGITRNVTLDLFEHYRNHFRLSGIAGQVVTNPYVPAYATTNLTVTFDTGAAWRVKDSQLFVSVSNLFNANPPITGYYSGTTSAGAGYEFADDPTGRAFTIGLRIKG
jgi:iron complex outermembrane recepter protein